MGKKGYLLCRNVENNSKSKLTNWRFPRVVGTIHFKRAPSKFSINLKSKIKTFKNSLNLDWKEKKTYEPKPPNMICQWREDSSHQTKIVPPWRPPFWIWFIIHLLPFPGLSSLCSPWQALMANISSYREWSIQAFVKCVRNDRIDHFSNKDCCYYPGLLA